MASSKKLQFLLISQLQKHGTVELLLPDGITLEIGVTQIDEAKQYVFGDDYCYVTAKKDNTSIMLDSYNLGLSFPDENNTIIYDDRAYGDNGESIRTLEVI